MWRVLNNKKAHDFVKHYEEGNEPLVEDEPLDINKTLNITKYQISYFKNSDYYNFSNSETVINEFLTNVKLNFNLYLCKLRLALLLRIVNLHCLRNIYRFIIVDIGLLTFILPLILIRFFTII